MNTDQNQLQSIYESVSDSVDISSNKLTVLPKDWSQVDLKGRFNCCYNELTSLDGAPRSVEGDFVCTFNKLTSLEGSPDYVGGYFSCRANELTSLKDAPRSVEGDFYCRSNKLTSLEGAPKHIGGKFYSDQFSDEDYREFIKYNKLRKKHKELEGIF